jgi:hypothetical protein
MNQRRQACEIWCGDESEHTYKFSKKYQRQAGCKQSFLCVFDVDFLSGIIFDPEDAKRRLTFNGLRGVMS